MKRRMMSVVCVSALAVLSVVQSAELTENTPLPRVRLREKTGPLEVSRQLSDEEYARLVNPRTYPVPSPIGGQVVHVIDKREDPKSNDRDADLCSHFSGGKVKITSEIVLDPWSGFAAYRDDFRKPQTAEVKAWVKRTLTPNLAKVLRQMVGNRQHLIPKSQIQKFFNRQENLPDMVRCEHALAYYNHIGGKPAKRARLAWLCAWSYRRAISDTVEGPCLMGGIRKVVKAVSSDCITGADLQKRINTLAGLYEDAERFTHYERQIIRVMLAGYYDRIGVTGWAKSCLELVRRSARKNYSSKEGNPWMAGVKANAEGFSAKEKRFKTVSPADTAAKRRMALDAAATSRLLQLEREVKYMKLASSLIRQALASGEYPEDKVPFFIYMVGEFERRCENYGAARLYLKTASQMLVKTGEPDYAGGQLAFMEEICGQMGADVVAAYDGRRKDENLLAMQARRIFSAEHRRTGQSNEEEIRALAPEGVTIPPRPGQTP